MSPQGVIEKMNLRFQSGNSVPVESSRITKEEWEVVKSLLKDESLSRLKAKWQAEILDYLKRKAADHRIPNYPVVPLSEVQRLINNRQAEGDDQ